MQERRSIIGVTAKRLLANLAVSLASLFAALTLCEAILRCCYKERIPLTPRYHTDARYGAFTLRRLRPNSVFWHTDVSGHWKFVTNSRGFRNDTDFSYDKPPGVFRVLSLGDSHTEGVDAQQDRTFSAVLERSLCERGIPTEVINSGVSGFSTAEELAFLENEGVRYHPDVVVLGFYANDFQDNVKAGIFALTKDGLTIKKTEHVPGVRVLNVLNRFALLRWLSENSYAYSFFLNGVWDYAKQRLLKTATAKLTTEYTVLVGSAEDYEMRLEGELIRRMYGFCREHDARLVILDIPQVSHGTEVYSSVPVELLSTFRLNSDALIYSREALRGCHNPADLYGRRGGGHISELTHLIYGRELARIMAAWRDSASATGGGG